MTPNLVETLMNGFHLERDSVDKAEFSQCADDAGVFTLDGGNTVSVPDPIVKNQDVTLKFRGQISEHVDVEIFHVHIELNGSPLFDEDIVGSK